MFTKTIKFIIPVIIFSVLMPFFGTEASNGYFTYRSTQMGSGTHQTGQWEYEISNEKYDFSSNESVFALSRIFNITKINTFQFKYEIRGAANRDMLSPVYRPNGNWWAEIWYWDEFGTLPAGSYTLHTMISVDGEGYKQLDSKQFRVSGTSYSTNYDYSYSNDYNYSNSYCQNPAYNFEWFKTGKNVNSTGSYAYEIVNQTNSFSTSDNVYALVKNTHINGTDTFRIKFDVYLNGNSLYKSNEVPTLNPNCQTWAYNYSWANLGSLPAGNHEIRTYIQFNGGSYRLLNTSKVNIATAYNSNYNNYNYDNNYRPPATPAQYSYSWTQTDNQIRYDGGYRYSVISAKTSFGSNDDIKVLTRLSDIKNINTFVIRHELHKDGGLVKKIESSERRPNGNNWDYNFAESNFGRLAGGTYDIRVYISVNGERWLYLDAKQISVGGSAYSMDDIGYDWTQVLTGNTANYTYTNYPRYY